jgi:hypothetical protein
MLRSARSDRDRLSTAYPSPMWGVESMAAGAILGDAGVMRRDMSRLPGLLRSLWRTAYPRPARLGECDRCHSDYVIPVAWQESGELGWWIRVRCGECTFVRDVEVSNEEAKRFERELDRGVQDIAATVARLERERMIADADALTTALQRDLIDPGDFCR